MYEVCLINNIDQPAYRPEIVTTTRALFASCFSFFVLGSGFGACGVGWGLEGIYEGDMVYT